MSKPEENSANPLYHDYAGTNLDKKKEFLDNKRPNFEAVSAEMNKYIVQAIDKVISRDDLFKIWKETHRPSALSVESPLKLYTEGKAKMAEVRNKVMNALFKDFGIKEAWDPSDESSEKMKDMDDKKREIILAFNSQNYDGVEKYFDAVVQWLYDNTKKS